MKIIETEECFQLQKGQVILIIKITTVAVAQIEKHLE